jgi:hypothetical protein
MHLLENQFGCHSIESVAVPHLAVTVRIRPAVWPTRGSAAELKTVCGVVWCGVVF